jgi:hypothetical protein
MAAELHADDRKRLCRHRPPYDKSRDSADVRAVLTEPE